MRAKDKNKETAIRKAAIEMIVEFGFDGLSMQKLAKKANVSPATIYLYFENREDLLNKLYIEVSNNITAAIIKDFDPKMDFATGLKKLWFNRFNYLTKHHHEHYFYQNFINSPLIKRVENNNESRDVLTEFWNNSIKNDEIDQLPFQVYWSLAFAPLYKLIQYQIEGIKGNKLEITENDILQVFERVLKGLKK